MLELLGRGRGVPQVVIVAVLGGSHGGGLGFLPLPELDGQSLPVLLELPQRD